MKVRWGCIGFIILLGSLIGYQILINSDIGNQAGLPVPTIHPIFVASSHYFRDLLVERDMFSAKTPFFISTLSPFTTPRASSTPFPTTTALPSPTISPGFTIVVIQPPTLTRSLTPTEPAIQITEIYTDTLTDIWRIKTDGNVSVDQENRTYKHSGSKSIAITPKESLALVTFYLRTGTNQQLLRDKVLGINFWINSGNDFLAIDDLAIGMIGSDGFPYWTSSDISVKPQLFNPVFTEEQEYLLGFNRAVPPNTWVEVEILLDDLEYDTNYQYVTGFQFKNNYGFLRTFYIDDISYFYLSDKD